MNVLFLCKKPPVPPSDGETIALHQMLQLLVSIGCEVTVLALATEKHPAPNEPNNELTNVTIKHHLINTTVSWKGAVRNLTSSLPYIVQRFYDKAFEELIIKDLNEKKIDVVQLEGAAMGQYIPAIRANSKAKIVFRPHNIEYKIWEQIAVTAGFVSKFYLKQMMIPHLRQYEKQVCTQVDGIIPIADTDASIIQKWTNTQKISIIPIGVDALDKPTELPSALNIGFIGDMQWQPNLQGFEWFVEHVWMEFIQKNKLATLHLAGRNSSLFEQNPPQFINHGEVVNAKDYLNNLSFTIVPLLAGSGMKIKVIESMSLGRCVLTTPIGAAGIVDSSKHGVFVLQTKKDWLALLNQLSADADLLVSSGKEAQTYVLENFHMQALSRKLKEFYSQC